MTNNQKAEYFKEQASESLRDYLNDNEVTPRLENVIYAEKIFKINSVFSHVTNMIATGTSERQKSKMLSMLRAVDNYAKNQNDIQWFQGEVITFNKGE